MRRLLLATGATVLLAGCAPDSGTVTDRKTIVSCISNFCSPKWKLQITNPNERHPVYTDRPDAGWTYVTEAEYGRCPVGAAWPDCRKGSR